MLMDKPSGEVIKEGSGSSKYGDSGAAESGEMENDYITLVTIDNVHCNEDASNK